MAYVDIDAIMSKVETYVSSKEFQTTFDNMAYNLIMSGGGVNGKSPAMAADKFIEVLRNEVQSLGTGGAYANGGLGATAIEAASSLEHGEPHRTGLNRYSIYVWFSGDLYRESLNPAKYGGVDNIVMLLNNGYDAGGTVYGIWHGNEIASLPHRGGAYFIQSAIRDFMANYASEYGVENIQIEA